MDLSTTEQPADLVPLEATILKEMGVNTEQDLITENVRASIRRGLPQLRPYAVQPTPVALVCGGPSINDCLEEIRQQYWEGSKLAAVNGTYEWLLQRGMRPAFMFMVDARGFNSRFLTRPAPHCSYWLASQCAPETFDRALGWPGADVRIWHAVAHESERDVLDRYYQGNYYAAAAGTTIGLRALGILQALGFRWLDVYGMDSCLTDAAHHAYSQPENDEEAQLPITVQVGDRFFKATLWQSLQAKETIEMLDKFPSESHITFHGDGLIAHLAKQRGSSARKE